MSELVEGRGGIFDVVVDGARIFCKDEVHRFPEARDIIASIRAIRP